LFHSIGHSTISLSTSRPTYRDTRPSCAPKLQPIAALKSASPFILPILVFNSTESASAEKALFQPDQGEPIMLHEPRRVRISAVVARRRMIPTTLTRILILSIAHSPYLAPVARLKTGAHPKLTRATPTRLLTAHKPIIVRGQFSKRPKL
jgi:hypothetical protein